LTVGSLEFEVRLVADIGASKQPEPENVRSAEARRPGSSADDDLDLSQWFDEMPNPSSAKQGVESKLPDAAGTGSQIPGEVVEESSEESQDQPVRDTSEERKEEMRRRGEIPGISKTAQAKRLSETTRDAAADALRRFSGGGG
jgi:hypothetical protein